LGEAGNAGILTEIPRLERLIGGLFMPRQKIGIFEISDHRSRQAAAHHADVLFVLLHARDGKINSLMRCAAISPEKATRQSARHGEFSGRGLAASFRSLAQERNIPSADFAKLMHKRINTQDVMVFCEEHHVSYDWLCFGDLGRLGE
jgi:hypothetical protein